MRIIAGLLAGLLFGIGLVVSGMSDPAKVLNFLDIAGSWDPSLAFVMGGRERDDISRLSLCLAPTRAKAC